MGDPRVAARKLLTDPVMAERVLRVCDAPSNIVVRGPADVTRLVYPLLAGHETERLVVIGLNTRHAVVDVDTMSIGGMMSTIVDPRVILRWALTRSRAVASIVLAHNHPSGDRSASDEDIAVTRTMRRACEVIGLRLHDHLIITDDPDQWTSMAASGHV